MRGRGREGEGSFRRWIYVEMRRKRWRILVERELKEEEMEEDEKKSQSHDSTLKQLYLY